MDAARDCRARWEECAAVAGLSSDDPLAEWAEPALEWLDEQDQLEESRQQWQRSLAALEHALDRERPRQELERHYHAARRFEQELPTLLERRYRQRIAGYELSHKRRHRLLLAAIVGAVLLTAGAIAAVIANQVAAASVRTAVAAIGSLMEENKVDEALEYYEKLLERDPKLSVFHDARPKPLPNQSKQHSVANPQLKKRP